MKWYEPFVAGFLTGVLLALWAYWPLVDWFVR